MTHSALDALFEIRQQKSFRFEEVAKVSVRQIQQGMYVAKRRPEAAPGFGAAQLNLYYCLAYALVHGDLTTKAFSAAALQDQRVHLMYDRIEVIADDDLSSEYPVQGRPAIVSVTLKDGSIWTTRTNVAKGDPTRPLTRDEILQKFSSNAATAFQNDRIEGIIETVSNLENFDTLSGLFAKLR
jgi:2-methylcitrate dehydratase